MTRTRTPLCLSIALFALAGAAQAGRPLVTEDTDLLLRGQCEAEGFVGRASTTGEPATRGWTLQGSCGIGVNPQLALPASRSRSEGVTGSGLLFGGRAGLLPRDGDAPASRSRCRSATASS